MLNWRFIEWHKVWTLSPKVGLLIGVGISGLINLTLYWYWNAWHSEQKQQYLHLYQQQDIVRITLLNELRTYREVNVDYGQAYHEKLSQLAPPFSAQDFYAYIAPKLPQSIEVESWHWSTVDNRLRLHITLYGEFDAFHRLSVDVLNYPYLNRIAMLRVERGGERLKAVMDIDFYAPNIPFNGERNED
ncbi:hypothetical protein [Vibrio gallicus]|uniref:hypothetical protein n=1 Tax=Vibrio gallicus TaxID=190897 RepID=UPI0021C4816D|nr:hypothetical protein [Vibrio gallicus]